MNIGILLILVVAILFKLFPPRKINGFYGYRTARSMANIENWKLANNYSSNLMIVVFSLLTILNFILEQMGIKDEKIILGLIIVSFGLVIFLTEQKLKNESEKK